MKKRPLFFLSLIGVSAVLAWFWFDGLQIQYARLFGPAAKFTFRQLGIHKSGLRLVIEHFTSIIPFIALVVSLPSVKLGKRLRRLAYGLIILMIVHFLMIVGASAIYSNWSLSKTTYKFLFPMLTINDALPLVLWFVFFSDEILKLFSRKQAAESTDEKN